MVLRPMWNDSIQMDTVTSLVYFVIKYVERYGIDTTIGVSDKQPQIWFIPNLGDLHQPGTESLVRYALETERKMDAIGKAVGFMADSKKRA